MKRLAFLLPTFALAACAGQTSLSTGQSLYLAYGSYSEAVKAARDYADTPTASPAVVQAVNAVNRSDEVKGAVRYGKAYTLCKASNATVIAGLDCTLFDFKPRTASAYAITLRAALLRIESARQGAAQ